MAAFVSTSPTFTNNTLYGNSAATGSGGGLFFEGNYSSDPAEIVNSILWNDSLPVGKEIAVTQGTVVEISYCDVEGGMNSVDGPITWRAGMIDSDPRLYDPDHPDWPDFHLAWPSPCRDRGNNDAVLPPVDLPEYFEGDPRIAFDTVDMGADEYYSLLSKIGI